MKKLNFLFLIILFQLVPIFADEGTTALKLDLPVFDIPYQIDVIDTLGKGFFGSYATPSYAQSLAITTNIFSAAHFGFRKMNDNWKGNQILKYIAYYGGIVVTDYILLYMPGGNAWMHEEFHRASMSRFHVNSFNTVNTFPIGKEILPVNRIKDEDLERFKAESPTDFIRMHVAGGEGELLLIDRLQRNNFFYNQNLPNEFFYWFTFFNCIMYIGSVSDVDVDLSPNYVNEPMKERDFTGHDYTAWVYDLFRPNEPYADRGVHPTGVGIDRYIETSDLTGKELAYVERQRWLSLLNLASPMMIGFKSLPWFDTDVRWNFTFRHNLTSFGTDTSLNLYLNKGDLNFIFVYHNYMNYKNVFPAIEVEMIDYPLQIGNLNFLISPRIMLGMQPKDQNFFTSEPEFFGLIGSRVDWKLHKNWLPYFEFSAKTNGWIAGNVYTKSNIDFILGISARF